MKRFRFRLERVLQLRSRQERERARLLGQAIRDEQARKDAVDEAVSRLDRCGEQISGSGERIVTAGSLRNLNLTMQAAAQEAEAAADLHRAAEENVEQEQERFGQARIERRVVERLRERRLESWTQEASREEQKEIDGVSEQRRARGDRL